MLIFTQKYETGLDRFVNKYKKKGFWLYSGVILLSVGYVMYEISHLPQLPDNKDKKKLKKEKKKEGVTDAAEEGQSQSNSDIPSDHPINSWSKKQLYEYLHREKIYHSVDENISIVRGKVYEIYESKNNNNNSV